ncbi:unnamed protein product [Amaranthus hypochondriacus]
MGDPNGTSLPPGCRFYPSEEELLHYYLPYKNNNKSLPLQLSSSFGLNPNFYDTIKEINLYNFNPFELPVFTCFKFGFRGRKRHWYCYTERVNSSEERKSRRKAGFGFWKMKGKGKDVIGNGGKVVLGRRKSFIFYMEKFHGKAAVRTDWVMYEYALISNLKVKSPEHVVISDLLVDSLTVQHLACIREGDYLELDDLVG